MSRRLYVGRLSWGTTSHSLRAAFEEYGEVEDAIVMQAKDKDTGELRRAPDGRILSAGFGFVTMTNDEEAEKAILFYNDNNELDGRRIVVNDALKRESAPFRGGNDRGGNDRGDRGGNDRAPRPQQAASEEAPAMQMPADDASGDQE